MSRWEALYRLLEAAISQSGRTPRLLAIILTVTAAIVALFAAFALLVGPHVHAELARDLWRVIHAVGRYPPLG